MICGIDEAGRGCIAGALFVCGVVARQETLENLGIRDSKKISRKKREEIAKLLENLANRGFIFFHIVRHSATQIDKLGISTCLKHSLEEIMLVCKDKFEDITYPSSIDSKIDTSFFPSKNRSFIYDGNCTFGARVSEFCSLETLIKGDDKNLVISAASILAKHAKDDEMQGLDSRFQGYNFISHSGYGTQAHREAIKKLGLIEGIHRKSFCQKFANPIH